MGYTHYWYVDKPIEKEKMKAISNDFKKLMPKFKDMGILLADGWGENEPLITDTEIKFNGKENCGHEKQDLGITWPSDIAGGVNSDDNTIAGSWFGGAQLSTRTCGGDCSHETFGLSIKDSDFAFCKTAYKPYDLAVNCALIIAKHHLQDGLRVHSDGEDKDWHDGMILCHRYLDYGMGFKIDCEDEAEIEG